MIKFVKIFVDFIVFVVFIFVSTLIVIYYFFINALTVQLSSLIILFVFIFSNLISNFINLKVVLSNEIIVYDKTSINEQIFFVAKTYSKIGKNIENTINISINQRINIFIISKIKSNFNKIYFFNSKKQKNRRQKN